MEQENHLEIAKLRAEEAERLKQEVISLIDKLKKNSLSAEPAKIREHHLHTNNIILRLLLTQQTLIGNITALLCALAKNADQSQKALNILMAAKIDEIKNNPKK